MASTVVAPTLPSRAHPAAPASLSAADLWKGAKEAARFEARNLGGDPNEDAALAGEPDSVILMLESSDSHGESVQLVQSLKFLSHSPTDPASPVDIYKDTGGAALVDYAALTFRRRELVSALSPQFARTEMSRAPTMRGQLSGSPSVPNPSSASSSANVQCESSVWICRPSEVPANFDLIKKCLLRDAHSHFVKIGGAEEEGSSISSYFPMALITFSLAKPWSAVKEVKKALDTLSGLMSSVMEDTHATEEGRSKNLQFLMASLVKARKENEAYVKAQRSTEPPAVDAAATEASYLPIGIPIVLVGVGAQCILDPSSSSKSANQTMSEHEVLAAHLRRLARQYGAALIYTPTPTDLPRCDDSVYDYLNHRILKAPLKRKPSTTPLERLFLPAGWDTQEEIDAAIKVTLAQSFDTPIETFITTTGVQSRDPFMNASSPAAEAQPLARFLATVLEKSPQFSFSEDQNAMGASVEIRGMALSDQQQSTERKFNEQPVPVSGAKSVRVPRTEPREDATKAASAKTTRPSRTSEAASTRERSRPAASANPEMLKSYLKDILGKSGAPATDEAVNVTSLGSEKVRKSRPKTTTEKPVVATPEPPAEE